MSNLRIIAEFCDFETMRRALNAGREFRDMSFKEMDTISGQSDGYFSKVLAPGGSRRVTMDSLGTAFGTIGMKCLVVEDEQAWNRIKNRVGKRANGLVRGGTINFAISRKFLRKIQKQGGKARIAKLKASGLLAEHQREAAKARWLKWNEIKEAANGGSKSRPP